MELFCFPLPQWSMSHRILRTTVWRPRACRTALPVKSTACCYWNWVLGNRCNPCLWRKPPLRRKMMYVYTVNLLSHYYPIIKIVFMKQSELYYLTEFFSSVPLYTVVTQVVIFPFSLNTPILFLPQDLCTCCPAHSLLFGSNSFSLQKFFLTSGALTLLSDLTICLSPFHSPIYFLYSRFHQLIPFCWFLSLRIFWFSSFIESEFCESRNGGSLVFHGIPKV